MRAFIPTARQDSPVAGAPEPPDTDPTPAGAGKLSDGWYILVKPEVAI
jgi:hypothetical protein